MMSRNSNSTLYSRMCSFKVGLSWLNAHRGITERSELHANRVTSLSKARRYRTITLVTGFLNAPAYQRKGHSLTALSFI